MELQGKSLNNCGTPLSFTFEFHGKMDVLYLPEMKFHQKQNKNEINENPKCWNMGVCRLRHVMNVMNFPKLLGTLDY